jgi:xylulokinase
VPVTVLEDAEYVALGAARQAAWAMSGGPEPPQWPLAGSNAEYTSDLVPLVRQRYAALRDATVGWDATDDSGAADG